MPDQTIARGPSGPYYYGWNIVAACILSQVAANSLTYNAFSLFVQDWSRDLHTPASVLMLCIGSLIWVTALAAPLVGMLADKYPARLIFAAGLLGMALFYVLMSFTTTGWQAIALYATLGSFSLALCTAVTANAVITRWFTQRIGLALGLSAFGIGLGGVLIPPIVAIALPAIGWRMLWQIGGGVLLVFVLPLILLVIRDRPTAREGLHYMTASDGLAQPSAHAHGGAGNSNLRVRDVLTRRNFWLLIGSYIPLTAIAGACTQNLAPYAESHGMDQASAGWLLALLSFAHVVATLALGMLADRFGNRLPLVGLALLVAAGTAILAFYPEHHAIVIGVLLVGLGTGVFTPLAAAIAKEFGAQDFGRAFGLAMIFLPLASPFGFTLARSHEVLGSYAPALIGFGVLALMSGGFAFMLREGKSG